MLIQRPHWLPALFVVSPWEETTYALLYALFEKDFIKNKTYYRRRNHVSFIKNKEDGKELIFWHITTRDDKTKTQRLPDFRRCERLPWLKPLLENASDPYIAAWEILEKNGTTKIYVWLKDHDYIAIMKKTKKGYLILLTAYWIEYNHTKKKLLKKYNANNKKPTRNVGSTPSTVGR